MRFVIIRHGQSSNNLRRLDESGALVRKAEPPLTELGHAQSLALANHVAKRNGSERITAIYSSLMVRALQTAHYLGEALELPVHGHVGLVEVGGPFSVDEEGKRVAERGAGRTEVLQACPRLRVPDIVTGEGWWAGPPEREAAVVDARVTALIRDLREREPNDGVIALITHEGLGQRVLRVMLELADVKGWFNFYNTAVIELYDEQEPFEGTVTVHRTNDTSHLGSHQLSE